MVIAAWCWYAPGDGGRQLVGSEGGWMARPEAKWANREQESCACAFRSQYLIARCLGSWMVRLKIQVVSMDPSVSKSLDQRISCSSPLILRFLTMIGWS